MLSHSCTHVYLIWTVSTALRLRQVFQVLASFVHHSSIQRPIMANIVAALAGEAAAMIWELYPESDDFDLGHAVRFDVVNDTDIVLERTECTDDHCEWGYAYSGRSFYNTRPPQEIYPKSHSNNGTATARWDQMDIRSVVHYAEKGGNGQAILGFYFNNPTGSSNHISVSIDSGFENQGYRYAYRTIKEGDLGRDWSFVVALSKSLNMKLRVESLLNA